MSKTAEQKALEAYPVKELKDNFGTRDINRCIRDVFIQGYDKAIKDFLEKSNEFFYKQFNMHPHDYYIVHYILNEPLEDIDDFIEQFKNYMQDEEM